MTRSLRYERNADRVRVQDFGIIRPTNVDVQSGLQTIDMLGQLGSAAMGEYQQQKVREATREGEAAALKRNDDGSLAPIQMWDEGTAVGRAYNTAAANAYTTSALLDAQRFGTETVTRLNTERATNPDGTPGGLKSADKVADFDVAWSSYTERTLENLPDQVRGNVKPRLEVEGARIRGGIAEKQYVEQVSRQIDDMSIGMSRLAKDVTALSFTGKEAEAIQALTDLGALKESIYAVGGNLVDRKQVEAFFENAVNSRVAALVYREGLDIFTKEDGKGRNREAAGLEAASKWIDAQDISLEQKNTARSLIAAQAESLQRARGEDNARAYENFSPQMGAFVAKLQTIARDKGDEAALEFAQKEAAGTQVPAIRMFWSQQAVNYGSRLGASSAEQVVAHANAVEEFARGQDPSKILEYAAEGRFGITESVRNANIARAVAASEAYKTRVRSAQAATNGALVGINSLREGGIDTVSGRADYNKHGNTIYSGYEMPERPGQKVRAFDVRFEQNPTGFMTFIDPEKGIGMIPSDAVRDIMAWSRRGSETPEETLKLAQMLGTVLNDPNNKVNLGEFSAEQLSMLRGTVNRVLSVTQRYPVAADASPEDKARAQALIAKDIGQTFSDVQAIRVDTPEQLKQRVDYNRGQMLQNFRVNGIVEPDKMATYFPGSGQVTQDQIVQAVARDASGIRVGGRITLFGGRVPIDTTRLMNIAGAEIDTYEAALRLGQPISTALEWLGDGAKAWLGTETGGEALRTMWDRVFQSQNLIVQPKVAGDIGQILNYNLAADNLADRERYDRTVNAAAERYGATQFAPGVREGKATLVEQPIERTVGGVRPAQVLLTRFVEKNMDELTRFYGGNVDPRVAVMRGDVYARYAGTVQNEAGELFHRYQVSARNEDGRTYFMPETMTLKAETGKEIDRLRLEAQRAEATRIREIRQGGGNPFPVVGNPDQLASRPDPARGLAVGDLGGNKDRNETMAVYLAGVRAARAYLQEYNFMVDMSPTRFPDAATRKPTP
jgi:hypothetical protein